MFCFRCGASMPDDAQVCPQCAAPVQNAPAPPPASTPTPPPPSAWLNAPPAPAQYPGQPYGQAQPYQQPVTDGKATTSLVLGILSILCFGILAGIPAIIFGHISRGNIRRSMGQLSGGGMALAGLILGYCSVFFSVLLIAAIVIPNLTRARMIANESAAASTVRSINTWQVTYSTTYPDKGYAPDLATLGPGQSGSCAGGPGTAEHACLLDGALGDSSCIAGAWCSKNSYKFSMSAEENCSEPAPGQEKGAQHCNYVVVATPMNDVAGRKSFCSTSDAVIRQHSGMVSQPITVDECSGWMPMR